MRRLHSVRARTTLFALAVFAIALIIASLSIVIVLQRTMTENLDTALELRARDVGALVEAGTAPAEVAINDEEDAFVQIVLRGEVVASSSNIEGEAPLLALRPAKPVTVESHPIDDDDRFRVLVSQTGSPSGDVTMIFGTTLETVDSTIAAAAVALMVAVPALLLLAGALTWFAVGRGLRPVEEIRSEVAEIGSSELHRRVPLPETDDEIGRLAVTMNAMLERIESGSVRQQRFVSDASHELRTPIAIIRHELEVALQHRASADWPAVAQDILEEDLRMQRLVDDLLWLARNDQDSRPRTSELIDLDDVVLTQATRCRSEWPIMIDTSGVSAGQVRGNIDDLMSVVQNLLSNALRHAKTQVSLTVTSNGAGEVLLRVADDGEGVPLSMRETILERFTRSDEARSRDGGGAGLGLAIVSEIVDDLGGQLSVEDSVLGGAQFSVQLSDARQS